MLNEKSLRSRLKAVKSIFLIGDQGCDKSFIFEFLELEQEDINHQPNIYVKVFEDLSSIQLYDFPVDKMIRNSMELYLKLLPQPISIIYFIKNEGVEKDIGEWARILHNCNISAKLLFISDVATYIDREKILLRVSRQFQMPNILDIIYFVRLEPYSFRRAFDHLENIGVLIEAANCLKPTLTRRLMNSIAKFIRKMKRKREEVSYNSQSSVI